MPVKINIAKLPIKVYISYMDYQLSYMIDIVKRYNYETISY